MPLSLSDPQVKATADSVLKELGINSIEEVQDENIPKLAELVKRRLSLQGSIPTPNKPKSSSAGNRFADTFGQEVYSLVESPINLANALFGGGNIQPKPEPTPFAPASTSVQMPPNQLRFGPPTPPESILKQIGDVGLGMGKGLLELTTGAKAEEGFSAENLARAAVNVPVNLLLAGGLLRGGEKKVAEAIVPKTEEALSPTTQARIQKGITKGAERTPEALKAQTLKTGLRETGQQLRSFEARRFDLAPADMAQFEDLLLKQGQLKEKINLAPAIRENLQSEGINVGQPIDVAIKSPEIVSLRTIGRAQAARQVLTKTGLSPLEEQPHNLLNFFENTLDQLPMTASEPQMARKFLISQVAGNETDRLLQNVFQKLAPSTLAKDENRAIGLLSDYQNLGFGPQLSAKYSAEELKGLRYAASVTDYLATQAEKRGFLNDFLQNYFQQTWVVPNKLRDEFNRVVSSPQFVSRAFPRSVARVFPDIKSGLGFFAEQAKTTGNDLWLKVKPISDVGILTRQYFQQYGRTSALRNIADIALDTQMDALGTKMAVRLPLGTPAPSGFTQLSPSAFGQGFYANNKVVPFLEDISRTSPDFLGKKFQQFSFFVKRAKLLFDAPFHIVSTMSRGAGIFARNIFEANSAKNFKQGFSLSRDLIHEGIQDGLMPIGNLKSAINLQNDWNTIVNTETSALNERMMAGFKTVGNGVDLLIKTPSEKMFQFLEHVQGGIYAVEKARLLPRFIKPGMDEGAIAEATQKAGRVAAENANTIVGAFPSGILKKATQQTLRNLLLGPSWTASQIDQILQAVGKSPILKGLSGDMKTEVAKNAWSSFAAGMFVPLAATEALNLYWHGYTTFDRRHGTSNHIFDLKLPDGRYLRTPIGFFGNQLLGYAVDMGGLGKAFVGNQPPRQKTLSDLKLWGKLNPVITGIAEGMYSPFTANPRGQLLKAAVEFFTPIGFSGPIGPGEKILSKEGALRVATGANIYPKQFGGSAMPILRSIAEIKDYARQDVFQHEREFLRNGDLGGLIDYLSSVKNPTDLQSAFLLMAKTAALKNVDKAYLREKLPYTTFFKSFGPNALQMMLQNVDEDTRNDIVAGLAEETKGQIK